MTTPTKADIMMLVNETKQEAGSLREGKSSSHPWDTANLLYRCADAIEKLLAAEPAPVISRLLDRASEALSRSASAPSAATEGKQ